jgi:glycosyltransferase involved in cell wall biosynthesis
MKIVLAHDSYTQLGGAERVMEALHELYPEAPLSTLVVDKKFTEYLKGWQVNTSILQPLYNLWPHFKHFLFLLIIGTKSLRFPQSSVIISSSSLFLKGIRKPANSIHINYCHTPVRFLWTEPDYIKQEVPILLRPLVRAYFLYLRKWDQQAASKVDYFIANSREVQDRIKRFYNRESVIVPPFIDVNFWHPTRSKQDYFLVAGRLQAYKNFDVVIKAFNSLGWPLHIVGTGDHERILKSLGGSNVTFLGRVSDEALRDEYSGARGLIFPSFEDFGITPLEAAACGTPTLGLAKGGSLETVVPGITGELLPEITEQTLSTALKNWVDNYDPKKLLQHAKAFSKENFQRQIKEFVNNVIEQNHQESTQV